MVDEIFLNKRKNVFINDKYEKKELMTQYEQYFYNVIRKRLNHKYIIIPQVNLATIVNKKKKSYCNELFRNIDFGSKYCNKPDYIIKRILDIIEKD